VTLSVAFINFAAVSKYYGHRPALIDFTLAVEKRERVAILGHSGCGKTTVLRLLAGFVAPDSGVIAIDGEVVSADGRILKDPEERKLGMVFQDLALWPHMTVKGNLEFGLKAMGIPKSEREDRVGAFLRLIKMEDRTRSRPAELSGGEQQRVALARALVLEPVALLMDEPLSSLNVELSIMLRREIVRLQDRIGFSLLYVTHNHEEAFDLGTQVLLMGQGKIKHCGPPAEIQEYLRRIPG
jgi:ABC-type Fe3+/spermidine/putrescine transport system ATPase subunit